MAPRTKTPAPEPEIPDTPEVTPPDPTLQQAAQLLSTAIEWVRMPPSDSVSPERQQQQVRAAFNYVIQAAAGQSNVTSLNRAQRRAPIKRPRSPRKTVARK